MRSRFPSPVCQCIHIKEISTAANPDRYRIVLNDIQHYVIAMLGRGKKENNAESQVNLVSINTTIRSKSRYSRGGASGRVFRAIKNLSSKYCEGQRVSKLPSELTAYANFRITVL